MKIDLRELEDGETAFKFEQEPADLDLPDNVRRVGRVPHEGLAQRTEGWSIGIVP